MTPTRGPATGATGAETAAPANLASVMVGRATLDPGRTALVVPTDWDDRRVLSFVTITYGQFARRVSAWQRRLAAGGLSEGQRVLILLPVSADLYASAFAAIASGMTVVLVDRGMSISRARAAVDAVSPNAMVADGSVPRLARLIPELRRIPRTIPADLNEAEIADADPRPTVADRRATDEAIVSFTSGSTGRPKGADRTQGVLWAQHESLERAFPNRPDDVDMTAWPVLVLHDLLVGIPSVLPPIRRGALREVPAEATLAFAIEQGVTILNGPPAFLAPIVGRAAKRGAVPRCAES